jgi:hypothetical protein
MEDLGVDENMSQGSDGSLPDHYESSVSDKDVFASKLSKKVKATENE